MPTSACHGAEEKLPHVLFLQKDQIFGKEWLALQCKFLQEWLALPFWRMKILVLKIQWPNLAMLHLHLLQSSSSLLYPRGLLAFAANQVCPGVLSLQLVLHRTDKFMAQRPFQSTVNMDNFKTKFLNKKRIEHKPPVG